jgi:hypothetical protein
MGANATTFVPSYTSGEVLTAANLSVTNSGIPVFADSTARDNSFGGTGEKALAEGQFAYLEDTNTTQYYDGATWQSVGVAPGLVFITGASFTTVTSVSLPAATFSTTYRNYKILFEVTATSASGGTSIRMRAAGSDNTTSNYRQMETGITQANSTSNNARDNVSNWEGMSGPIAMDVFSPQATNVTHVIGGYTNSNPFSIIGRTLNGIFVATTSFDSMSFICGSGNFTGYYRVYGWADA